MTGVPGEKEMSQPFEQTSWFGAIVGSVCTAIVTRLFRLLRAPDREDLARVAKFAKTEIAASEVRTANALIALENRLEERVKDIKADGEARTQRIENQITAGFAGVHGRIDGLWQRRSR